MLSLTTPMAWYLYKSSFFIAMCAEYFLFVHREMVSVSWFFIEGFFILEGVPYFWEKALLMNVASVMLFCIDA